VKAAAETFRANPDLDVATAITELAVGEALVSLLDEKGRPGIVERAFVCPPESQLAPITPEERQQVIRTSLLAGHYEQAVDRESAFEKLKARAEAAMQQEAAEAQAKAEAKAAKEPARRSDSMVEAFGKSVIRAAGSSIGRQIIRGVMGSIFGGGGRRR
jgi:DNA helicase HerA-like ATPase